MVMSKGFAKIMCSLVLNRSANTCPLHDRYMQNANPEVMRHVCRWLQPTIEIVGMRGGHTAEGVLSVVVSKAFAKVLCRLVPDQKATAVLKDMQQHVAAYAPAHTNFSLTAVDFNGRFMTEPYYISKDAPGNRAAAKVEFRLDVLAWRCIGIRPENCYG